MKKHVFFLLGFFSIIYAIRQDILHKDSHGSYLPRVYNVAGEKIELGGYGNLEYHLKQGRSEVTAMSILMQGISRLGRSFPLIA